MPLLHKYNVSAYLSGHDHSLQHISNKNFGSTVEYIVSGTNSLNSNSIAKLNTIPSGSLKFQWPTKTDYINGGFLMIQADTKSMTINFIKSCPNTFLGIPTGGYSTSVLYTKVILPRV
jgi:tartrate-resistant acid phosphatase type 5